MAALHRWSLVARRPEGSNVRVAVDTLNSGAAAFGVSV
jgi:hypothetical protein